MQQEEYSYCDIIKVLIDTIIRVQKTKKQLTKGFSLIEVLVVIGIITIMTAALLVSVRDERERRIVRIAGEALIADLRAAQNIALTGKLVRGLRPCQVIFSMSPTGYGTGISAYDPSRPHSDGSPRSCIRGEESAQIKTGSMPSGITISSSSVVTAPILFSVPFGDVSVPVSAAASAFNGGPSIEYALNKSGLSPYRICFYQSGRIEARGFGAGSCN